MSVRHPISLNYSATTGPAGHAAGIFLEYCRQEYLERENARLQEEIHRLRRRLEWLEGLLSGRPDV